MAKRITLQDVANEAGVSKASASMALRNDKRIHEDTRRHIQEVADRLGYKPNAVMSKLMAQVKAYKEEGYHGNIGLIHVDRIRNMFDHVTTYGEWVDGASRQARRRGYQMEKFWLHEPGMTTDKLIKVMHARGVEGLLIPATYGFEHLPTEFDEVWDSFACVVIGIRKTKPAMHYASNEQYTTAFDAVRKARELGYQRVGLAIMDTVDQLVDYKLSAGFDSARRVLGMNLDVPNLVYHREKDGRERVQNWFKSYNPDVIICIDYMVKLWLEESGCVIPKHVGLIGLDAHEDAVDWAGMNQRNDLVGEAAVELLIRQIQFDEVGPPKNPTCTQVTSVWKDGGSVIQQ